SKRDWSSDVCSSDLSLPAGDTSGPPIAMGRVHIGLAVKSGAPHPDISTVSQLVAALKNAKIGVAYSNPDPARGSMVAKMVDALRSEERRVGKDCRCR